jgi:hypothetical protein|tara:strand:- start:38 stop:256 length:219 start_codon:yes stop_codon:yes gene_type:complete
MAFKMKGFEPHNMYDAQKAETHKEHLALKEKGYKHSPYKKEKGLDGKACWKGYTQRGTKMKGGKRVDNCVKN